MTSQVLVEKKKLDHPPRDIRYLGDRDLRQSAKRVAQVDADIRQLVREMLQSMYTADGIGLAAPQVGIQKQVIVVDCDLENPATPPLVLINPVIKKFGGNECVYQEGCLSIPGVYLDVKRPEIIEVAFKDERGRPQKMTANGIVSRCIQHEMDHLKGVLFVDRVENQLALTEELTKQGFSTKDVKSML